MRCFFYGVSFVSFNLKVIHCSQVGNIFKIPPNKMVDVYDLETKLLKKRNLRDFKFRVGAFGILKKENKILVERHPLSHKYVLPGGGVEIGETIAQGLKREFEEETGIRVKLERLFFVNEHMFTLRGEDAQGVFIYYEVQKIGGKLLKDGNGEDTAEVRFMDIDKLSEDNIQKTYWQAIKSFREI